MPTAQIYIKQDEQCIWMDFKAVCKVNDWKHSAILMEKVREVVRLHKGGGSQTLMDYAGQPKTLPRFKTCKYSKHKQLFKKEFLCVGSYHGWKIPMACDQCRDYEEDSAV